MAPTVTIIVVNYQTGDEIRRLWTSLLAHPPAIEWGLLIGDNASPDDSGALLAAAFAGEPRVQVLEMGSNLGFGQACNQLTDSTSAPYLFFLNPDCLVEDDSIAAAVEYLDAHPQTGVVGTQVWRGDGTLEPTARTFPDPWSGLAGRKSLLRKIWPGNPLSRRFMVADQAVSGQALATDWVAGTAMCVRREQFLQLGGFDPDYFLYWEDADLCKRYSDKLGLGAIYLPVGRIVHHGDGAASKAKPFAVRMFHRAAYMYVKKHIAPSPLNPLRWFAWAALGLRARMILLKG